MENLQHCFGFDLNVSVLSSLYRRIDHDNGVKPRTLSDMKTKISSTVNVHKINNTYDYIYRFT